MRITPVAGVAPAVPVERVAAAPVAAPQVPARLLNPQPVIDPALGIVVTEYFNQSGQMTDQYPSARAIDTYRIYGLHGGTDEQMPGRDTPGS